MRIYPRSQSRWQGRESDSISQILFYKSGNRNIPNSSELIWKKTGTPPCCSERALTLEFSYQHIPQGELLPKEAGTWCWVQRHFSSWRKRRSSPGFLTGKRNILSIHWAMIKVTWRAGALKKMQKSAEGGRLILWRQNSCLKPLWTRSLFFICCPLWGERAPFGNPKAAYREKYQWKSPDLFILPQVMRLPLEWDNS